MNEIVQDIKKECEVAENKLQREIITEFYLAGITFEIDKLRIYELKAITLMKLKASIGVFINENEAACLLVDLFRPYLTTNDLTRAFRIFGMKTKEAMSGMNTMADVLSMESLNIKKKKNWKAKTIWDREGI